MADSLVVGEGIELIGGPNGVPSENPLCTGAIFRLLAPGSALGGGGYDLGAPQPTTDIIGSMLLDGERPFGYRASNRTITLPILIRAPDFQTLIGAREVLMQEIDQQTWSLRWTRDTAGVFAGNATALPLLFDCFRAQPTVVSWGAFYNRVPYGIVTLTFSAMPYGRSDTPTIVDFTSPIAGAATPATAVTIDDYASVSGTQWAAKPNSVDGSQSAYWDSSIAPASSSTGLGVKAVYTKSGLSKDLTGLNALTIWVGLGSTSFYSHFCKNGGRVTIAFVLTDNSADTIKFSKTVKLYGSNRNGAPKWTKIRIPIRLGNAAFNYANMTAYTITVTNRANPAGMAYTRLYLDTLKAVPATSLVPSPQRGACYDLAGFDGSARSPVSVVAQQPGSVSTVQKFNVPGTTTWLCPSGVTTVDVWCVGGGGASSETVFGTTSFGAAGGGGGSAHTASVAVTAGTTYQVTVGKGGTAGTSPVNGKQSIFIGGSTVTANGGVSPARNATTGGAGGAAGTGGFAGGAGGNGSSPGGGGGGGSGGTTGAGGAGATGAAGGAAGVAGSGTVGISAKGGIGGTVTRAALPGVTPGGGGGGTCSSSGGTHTGKVGATGLVQLTYNQTPTFGTLLLHRPPVTAPDMLAPFVQMDITDVPDDATEYNVDSLNPAINARFEGTYTVMIVAWTWNSPANSRTITVTVKEKEQLGGATYTSTVFTDVIPNNLTTMSSTNAGKGPFVILGEMTLPIQELPADNENAYFTVTVNDTNTSDRFLDVLFLDTMGSTVIITSPTSYTNLYVDEPTVDKDLGLVMGSQYDRQDAMSVMDRAQVAGGPIAVNPHGNPTLMAYSEAGAPSLQLHYFPRWYLDRIV